MCQAVQLALESEVSGEVFQIATGIEMSIQELAELVQDVTGSSVKLSHGPSRQGDIRKNFSAIDKARTMLGWESYVELREGVISSWEWLRSWQE